jgi:hypothetical protein
MLRAERVLLSTEGTITGKEKVDEPIQREKKNYRKPNPQGRRRTGTMQLANNIARNPQYNSQRRPERTDDFKRKTRPSSTDARKKMQDRQTYRQPYRK